MRALPPFPSKDVKLSALPELMLKQCKPRLLSSLAQKLIGSTTNGVCLPPRGYNDVPFMYMDLSKNTLRSVCRGNRGTKQDQEHQPADSHCHQGFTKMPRPLLQTALEQSKAEACLLHCHCYRHRGMLTFSVPGAHKLR